MPNRIDDGRRGAVHRQLADTLGAERTAPIGPLEQHHIDGRRVARRRDQVVGQLGVRHPPVAHDDLLEERVADPLERAALDLPAREHRIDHAADLGHRGHPHGLHLVRVGIELDLDDVAAPGVGAVRVAAVGILVPLNLRRLDVLRRHDEIAVLPQVLARRQPAKTRLHLGGAALEQTADDHGGTRRHGGTAVWHLRGVGPNDLDGVVRKAKRLGHDLRVHGARALPDLGAGHADPRAALGQLERRLRRELHLPRPGEPGAVEDERQADAARRARVRPALAMEIAPPHRLAQHVESARVAAERLPGRGGVARPEGVDLADPHRIDAEALGDAVQVHLRGKLRLRRAEPTERAVGWCVGHHDPPTHPHVIAAIRAGGVQHAAREHDGAQRRVRAAVEHDVDVHRRQPAVARHARPVANHAGMALGRRDHVLHPVVDHLDRPAGRAREERRVAREDGRILLFAAEASARLGLHDAHALARQAQQHAERALHVVRTLQRADHGDAVLGRNGEHAVGLDIELLLVRHAVLALDDLVGEAKALVDRSFVDGDLLERGGRSLGVVHGRGRAILDAHPGSGFEQALPILVGDDQDGLGVVTHLAVGEARLVVLDERHDVTARDVAGADDREAGRVEVDVDRRDLPARDRGPDRDPVEHARQHEIVHVGRLAGDLVEALLAGRARADDARATGPHPITLLSSDGVGPPEGGHYVSPATARLKAGTP